MTPAGSALIAAGVAAAGWAAGWLTARAALTAVVIGTPVLATGGLPGLALLGTFFASSSLLGARRAVGSRRTATQVVANGWSAALGALVLPVDVALGWAILAGGLAAAQADTWATEIGRRSSRAPRLLTTGRVVPPGTSGGVTWLGTFGGVAGAGVLAAVAWITGLRVHSGWLVAAGTGGMAFDSLLGATLQARFRCPTCDAIVEVPSHCAGRTILQRGVRWMTNDTVNVLGTGAGAAMAALAVSR